MGCRTQARAWAQATAESAWVDMAVMAVCRRMVCGAAGGGGAAPRDMELLMLVLKLVDWAPGLAELHAVGPNHKSAAK